ncbi:MAG: type IV pilus biogenesis/stability protein PilW [Burkholderiales bacterium]|nr:type IV pilus biogenesis/stability protein PilW [Burkholderiales bacterium]MDE2075959.1 type IV pilus biogenesis/stability protein PilW [Burkholderiales bacterium]MDE2431866.1 type IV pilus biogenesis/stability protein PilW [Burkholderiales bacterium]HET8694340.1 type IV pilus biogenesis/stability protein PilW [Aquabacterium sp.]
MTTYRSAWVPFFAASVVLVTCAHLSGCASGPRGGLRSTGDDLPTQSDETEVRKRARIRLELATTYYAQGQLTTALDELKQAVAIDPTLPASHELRGLIYDAMGETALADENFKKALSLDPHDGSVLHNYAWFLCRQGKYAAADAMFEQALTWPRTIPTSKVLLARGVCQVSAGLYPEAEKTLLKSYEQDPSNPATAYNLSAVLFRRGELNRALFYVRRVNSVPEQISAQSLWLAIRIEHKLGNQKAQDELADQLRSRFVGSKEATALELGHFDE